MTKLLFRIRDWCLDEPMHVGKLFVWMWLCMTVLALGAIAIVIWLAAVSVIWAGITWLFS